MLLGSAVTPEDPWKKPIAKYTSRAHSIGALGSSSEVSAGLYRSRALTVLSYVAQYLPPRRRLQHDEYCVFPRLLNMQCR
eukprot:2924749-Pyramimonas_sp.AAC.1